MFALCSNIKIGKYTFKGGFNELTIRKSIYEILDTGLLKIPVYASHKGTGVSRVQTAELFKEGDKVSIELGYNNDLKREFEGFVRRVNLTTPITLDLEGYGWQLRHKSINKSWKNTNLRQVLEEVIQGTDIVLSEHIPDVKLEKLYIPNKNGLEVLQYLRDNLHLTVYFNFNELYAGIQQGDIKGSIKYKLGWNVVRDDQLKYSLSEDTKVLVQVRRKQKGGEQVVFEAGEKGGDIFKYTLPNVTPEDAEKIANKLLKERKEKGYKGKLKAFLQPYCEPGYKAEIIDPMYEDRNGAFFISSTEVNYGMNGGRRIVRLAGKLS